MGRRKVRNSFVKESPRTKDYIWDDLVVRVEFDGTKEKIINLYTFLKRIREGKDRERIAKDGVFVVRISGQLLSEDYQFEGFLNQAVGKTRTYKYVYDVKGYKIPFRHEINNKKVDSRPISALLENSWYSCRWDVDMLDHFLDNLVSPRAHDYQQLNPIPLHSMQSVFDLNYFKDPLYYVKRGTSTRDNSRGMPGITSTSTYYSTPYTGTGFHVEDCWFCGVNFMDYGGTKLWIVLNPDNTKILINELKKATGVDCDHILDSKGYFIHPCQLTAWGIAYKIVIQKQGDLLVTTAGSAHMVCNMDFSINSTINYFDAQLDLETVLEAKETLCLCHKTASKKVQRELEMKQADYPFTRLHGQYIFDGFNFMEAIDAMNYALIPKRNDPLWMDPLCGTVTGIITRHTSVKVDNSTQTPSTETQELVVTSSSTQTMSRKEYLSMNLDNAREVPPKIDKNCTQSISTEDFTAESDRSLPKGSGKATKRRKLGIEKIVLPLKLKKMPQEHEEWKVENASDPRRRVFQCRYEKCPRAFSLGRVRWAHEQVHLNRKYTCKKCQSVFKYPNNMYRHQKLFHKT